MFVKEYLTLFRVQKGFIEEIVYELMVEGCDGGGGGGSSYYY